MIDLSTGKVVRHVEMWDIEPAKVVAQVGPSFYPSISNIPAVLIKLIPVEIPALT